MKVCRLGLVVAVLGVVVGLGSCTETNETKCTKDFLGNPTCTTTKGSDVGDWLKKNWYLVALGAVGWTLDSGDVIHAQVGHRYQVE